MRVVYSENKLDIIVYSSEEYQKTLVGKIIEDDDISNKLLYIFFEDRNENLLTIQPSADSWSLIRSIHLLLSDKHRETIFSHTIYEITIEKYSFNFVLRH